MCFFTAIFVAVPPQAHAIPVYLKPDSFYSSGAFPREVLERKTHAVTIERWLRVQTSDMKIGWLPEEYVLSDLKLAEFAITRKDETTPVRPLPQMESLDTHSWPPDFKIRVREIHGDWVKAERTTQLSGPSTSWLRTGELHTITDDVGKAWLKVTTGLKAIPRRNSETLITIPAYSFAQIVSEGSEWYKVQYDSETGYVPKQNAIVKHDLQKNYVYPLFAANMIHIPLRSAPSPEAPLIYTIEHVQTLKVVEIQLQKWGQVHLAEAGTFWWQIDEDDTVGHHITDGIKISTTELFNRKVFDMISSPDIPYLKFASARGIFRSYDGKSWEQLRFFKNENYPLATSSSGLIFVGPYASSDHGDSFEAFFRWESLITAARLKYHSSPRYLQIRKIVPLDFQGEQLELNMDLGFQTPSTMRSRDHGRHWEAL